MPAQFAPPSSDDIPLYVITSAQLENWYADLPQEQAAMIRAQGFAGGLGEAATVFQPSGKIAFAAVGYGTAKQRERSRFHLAAAVTKLFPGRYFLANEIPEGHAAQEALGWLLASYRFDRYRARNASQVKLVAPEGVDAQRIEAIVAGETLTRDLINTPAADMGPPDLKDAARALAERYDASFHVITGDALLAQNFPMIHAVGRAADQAPRLIELRFGSVGPKLTLVGKGVCFDTGGLNLKPASSMGLMKKDMGGAAAVLGLAQMIMSSRMPLRLRVLIPAVENAVSGKAFRPQDILTSRKGLTVEINNTDAEGRLVLADALALADEETPDQIISMATLTGAARVALGPDLAPYFSDDPHFASALETAALQEADPVWRMPFHSPYERMIEPGIADLDNAPKGGFAGAITAALFLRRFVTDSAYAHFDIYGWQPSDAPGRPKGGVGQGTRALFSALPEILGL
ncbi:MAG: leucyl aminopeptidase family protein [Pseudomonadota bacterium]